jgi:AraC family transcriptional regulator
LTVVRHGAVRLPFVRSRPAARKGGQQEGNAMIRNREAAAITARREGEPALRGLSHGQLERVTDYVEANLHEDLSVGELATTIYMSPSHFAHAFRVTTGFAPHRYVLERRIERAKSLLLGSRLSVAEIARRVGFTTHAHFSTMFRRMTGRTPIHFRRRMTSCN